MRSLCRQSWVEFVIAAWIVAPGPALAQDLPTVPHHNQPAWVWHHDLSADLGFTPEQAHCLTPGVGVGPTAFTDNLSGSNWHIEVKIMAGGPDPLGPGELCIQVPGGTWCRDYPSLDPGEIFEIAVADEEIIRNEAAAGPEQGTWTYRWISSIQGFCVDSSVAETGRVITGELRTPFDLGPDEPLPTGAVVLELTPETGPAPGLSKWWLILLILLILVAAVILGKRYLGRKSGAAPPT